MGGLTAAYAQAGAPSSWRPPPWWIDQARCIHGYEVYGHVGRVDEWSIVGSGRGGFQFLWGTWSSAGGQGDPALAAPREQLYRAYVVWRRDGGSWREWSTAGSCGLR